MRRAIRYVDWGYVAGRGYAAMRWCSTVFIVAGVTYIALSLYAGVSVQSYRLDQQRGVQAECQEDEPCWDCHTMGNRVCGPRVTSE